MFIARCSVEVLGPHIYSDASGAPAKVTVGRYVYACDYIGGDVRLNLIAPVSGSHMESKIAADRARRAYTAKLNELVTDDWKAASIALYRDEVAS